MAEQSIPATVAPVQGQELPLGQFMGRLRHPGGYPHSAIPFAERFPALLPGTLAKAKYHCGYDGEDQADTVRFLAEDLRILFGVPLPGEYVDVEGDGTTEDLIAFQTGGSHADQRRAIDDLKDRIIESIALDAETVRALGRSIDARLAALEALEAMMKEAEGVEGMVFGRNGSAKEVDHEC